ncbi:MAG TPA: phosphoribosylaminoimidazolesuccinocarboxamide synthase [Candidatus Cloacimonetes bacterium]|jgi:phosphoribosylaminoimidazole-succinocarboxamide synthase|nr:phosphoribosylaminoimidazolesuccinocarboxamide synthase [Candidatus Cloacimonas sp.]HHZ15239.1 phosphoribosylaminoimidazolesuccinocarboxamide synthase [Candidatus Cloacimonadota bacterium]
MFDKISKLECVKQARQGKVRDIYDLGDRLLLVTSDRISAFDVVFDQPIKDKGIILNKIAVSIFKATSHIVDNHLISSEVKDYPQELHEFKDYLEGRSMLVQKTRVIPFECIVRGYISGSAYGEYINKGTVGGKVIPNEMKESQKFDSPMFTPSTKAEEGHDVNISYRTMKAHMDTWIAEFLKDKSLQLYHFGHDMLLKKGIILADTKFEFGSYQGKIMLIDEALTPDSSRFWPVDDYEVGISPPSYDKQFIRNYLLNIGWDKQPPAPELPEDVIAQTRDKYLQIYKIITGETL